MSEIGVGLEAGLYFISKGWLKLGNTHIHCVKFGTISWLFAKKTKNKVHYLSEGNKTVN